MTTITIELPDDAAERVRDHARAQGMNLNEYATAVLVQATEQWDENAPGESAEIVAIVEEEIGRIASGDKGIPLDAAFPSIRPHLTHRRRSPST